MKLIAHRGNTDGPDSKLENTVPYIDLAISKGYDCEIDLWVDEGRLYLGHDGPWHEIQPEFLWDRVGSLFVHAKNAEALHWLTENRQYINFFSHDQDEFVVTSEGQVWCFPSEKPIPFGINLMPELNGLKPEDLADCVGICSDYISQYRELG